ncbi:MAG: class I SAM-dependent methyltransferase [Acidobacteria bacterium]|jgi:SAM-dependent methyltransferase|nr:class I SAM-dependent methyltransferase [Acidobacteriota bacterium]
MDAGRTIEHYKLQAGWLAPSRHYLYRRSGLAHCRRILDLGCGCGVISDELRRVSGQPVLGIDRDPEMVTAAREHFAGNEYMLADERALARKGMRFDMIVLSFVLMWQKRPLPFLRRVRKLLAPNGTLLVLAEPDYGGRIDYPEPLDFLKDIFSGHILQAGGDPFIGRRLAVLLRRAGFKAEVELASCLGFPAGVPAPAWEREWEFWQELAGFSDATLKRILRLEKSAAARGERLVLFPVFCALARPLPGR